MFVRLFEPPAPRYMKNILSMRKICDGLKINKKKPRDYRHYWKIGVKIYMYAVSEARTPSKYINLMGNVSFLPSLTISRIHPSIPHSTNLLLPPFVSSLYHTLHPSNPSPPFFFFLLLHISRDLASPPACPSHNLLRRCVAYSVSPCPADYPSFRRQSHISYPFLSHHKTSLGQKILTITLWAIR